MKTGKKLWSLLLALVMVVSLFGGISLVGAADDSVTITPDATYGGETITMTATGVGENVTVFDLASIGFGTGIEYCLWFDHDGTFSFDKDVTLTYQGSPKEDLKGGTVYKIADGISGGSWSELYVQLDDGNMLMILDSDAPGNFAALAPDTPLSDLPVTVSAGAAPAPAGETKTEETITEETKTEETAASSGSGYTKATSLEAGKEYLIVTESGGKYYALTCSGSLGAVEVIVADDAIAVADAAAIWLPDGNDHLESKNTAGQFIFASSGGLTLWDSSMLRTFIYDAATETVALHDSKYYLSFDGAKFSEVTDASGAAKILLFTGSGAAAPAETKPAEKVEYPAPETVTRSAVKNADGSITLAFTSDVHYDGVNNNLKTWLENSGVEYIDAMGFCGDMGSAYAANADDFWTWTGGVMEYMDSLIAEGKVGDAIYTLGNHEWFGPYAGGSYGTEYANYPAAQRLRQIGEGVVTDDYIIYCFGAGRIVGEEFRNDYDEADIAELDTWLANAPADTPIFIITHFPLHFWYNNRYAPHAVDVIDVLNKYGDDRDIVFFWGHNHSDYDDGYYAPKFPGDEITVNAQGDTRELNFTYLAAGCTSDAEYTGPSAGSASVMNKGLIVTINADGTLDYAYYTLDGEKVSLDGGPWLVRFRVGYGDYETLSVQSVEDGKTVEAPEAPELEGYAFDGWYYWNDYAETAFDLSAPVNRNYIVTAKYKKIIKPVAAPDKADCITVKPDATVGGESLTVTAAGVGDLITVFDLASIGYGTGIMYGFWFDADGLVSFDQDVTLLYQGAATDFTLKAGEFYSVEGFTECYVSLDDGNSFLLLEKENPGNYASLPGDQPFSVFPGTVNPGDAMVSNQALTVDGEAKEIDHYNIGGYNYFKLRDLACLLSGTGSAFNVEYDKAARTITLTPGAAYAPIGGELVIGADKSDTTVYSNQPVLVGSEAASITAFNIGGYNYFKLADLAPVLGFELTYDEGERTAQIATK